jgi:hypothetical protein
MRNQVAAIKSWYQRSWKNKKTRKWSMTNTLRTRFTRTKSRPHTHGPDGRSWRSGVPSDPAALAEALRILAIRAHHALRIAQDRVDESIRIELNDLSAAIHSLEEEFQTQQLDRMVPYVVSLRDEIDCLLS